MINKFFRNIWFCMQGKLPTILCLAAWVILGGVGAGASEEKSFTYTASLQDGTPIRWVVTSAGLSEIHLKERLFAKGGWSFENGSWLYEGVEDNDTVEPVSPEETGAARVKPVHQSLRIISDTRVEVRHETTAWRCFYTYDFADEDVTIVARVENCGDTPIPAVDFHGLVFQFDGEVQGYRKMKTRRLLQKHAATNVYFHPNFHNRIGGSYACDQQAGVGLAPLEPALARTLLWWEPSGTKPHYILPITLEPGSARTFRLALRVSHQCEWKHLLEPYKKHFQKIYGPVRYHADCRPVGMMSAVGDDRGGPGTDNPYGYIWHRFDKSGKADRGTEYILNRVIPALKTANGQGVIIWGLSGWNHTGPNFSPDFHALPPETLEQLPKLMSGFQDSKMKLGVLARPAEVVIQAPQYGRQTLIRIRADEPSQMSAMKKRFTVMQEHGFKLFYLDTFGAEFHDLPILIKLREGWTSDILSFSEFWNDVTMVYSGGYAMVVWDRNQNRYRDFWRRDREWEIIRWLVPGAQLLSPEPVFEDEFYHDGKPYFHDGAVQPLEAVLRRGITPLFYIGDSSTERRSTQLNKLTEVYVDEKKQLHNLDGPTVLEPIPPRRPGEQKTEAEQLEDELEGVKDDDSDFVPFIPKLDDSDVEIPGMEGM